MNKVLLIVFGCLCGAAAPLLLCAQARSNKATPDTAQSPPYATITLPDVLISKNRKDPAEAIMQHVIAMAPLYSRQVDHFTANVYIKGSANIKKISRAVKFMAKQELSEMKITDGTTMLMETINEIKFKAPDEFTHRVISSNTTMPREITDNFNTINFVAANLYTQNFVARNALQHYKYTYEGGYVLDGLYVSKIRMTPRTKNKELVNGYIYVIDDTWQIYKADVQGALPFVKFSVSATCIDIGQHVYIPGEYTIDADVNALGNKFSATYAVVMKYTNISINNTPVPIGGAITTAATAQAKTNAGASKRTVAPAKPKQVKHKSKRDSLKQKERIEKIEELMSKEELSNREMYRLNDLMKKEAESQYQQSLDLTGKYKVEIDSAAKQTHDIAYWDSVRPVPLHTEERVSYTRADSVRAIDDGRDSAARKKLRFALGTRVVMGGGFDVTDSLRLMYWGLVEVTNLSFNAVDGFRYGQNVRIRRRYADQREWSMRADVWYAFNREALMWKLSGNYDYYPERRAVAWAEAGLQSFDYNPHVRFDDLHYSALALALHLNYTRLYEQAYVAFGNGIDLANGLRLDVRAGYYDRRTLDNSTNFSFFYQDKTYAPNVPMNAILAESAPDISLSGAAVAEVALSYTPQYYYRMSGRRKRMLRSDYPTFTLAYKKGIPNIFGSRADYDLARLTISHTSNLGIMREFVYSAEAALFLNTNVVDFPDFYHFNMRGFSASVPSAPTAAQSHPIYDRYYKYSTNRWAATAHVKYTDPFILFKYIPYFDDTYCRENLRWHCHYVPHAGLYNELHYSISEIFLFMELGVFVGFEKARYSVLGFNINLKL